MAVGAGSAPSLAASSPGRLVAPSPGEIGRRRSRVRSRRRYSVLLHARVHVPKMPGVRKNTRNRITGSTRQHRRIQKAKLTWVSRSNWAFSSSVRTLTSASARRSCSRWTWARDSRQRRQWQAEWLRW